MERNGLARSCLGATESVTRLLINYLVSKSTLDTPAHLHSASRAENTGVVVQAIGGMSASHVRPMLFLKKIPFREFSRKNGITLLQSSLSSLPN